MSDREMPGWGKLLSHFERDARLASDDARKPLTPDEFAKQRASDWRVPATRAAYDVYLREFEAALPSPSGPDAETLAATVREGVSAAEVPLGVVSAAFSALSGLVALVEQRERERDEALAALKDEMRWDMGGVPENEYKRLIREFEQLPVRRVTDGTVVMERGPLDSWRAECGALSNLGESTVEAVPVSTHSGEQGREASGDSPTLARAEKAEALLAQRERERDELWKRGFAERERAEKAEALLAQRERERDDQRTRRYELAADATRKCTEFRERAEKAEALLTRYRLALEDIRDVPSERYLLHYPVAREMHEIALAALAASAPGTEET